MLLKLDELQALDKLLRLLHVVPTYLPAVRYGGTILAVHALCRELAARGHDVHVFTTSVDGPEDSNVPLGRPVDVEGVKVTYFPSRSLRRLYWAPPLKRALAAAMGGFDLVHVHALYLWPPWVAARLAKARRRPYVVSPHGMLVPELIRRKNRWVKAAWLALIDRRTLEEANAVHTASTVEALHLEGFGWSLPRVITIPHGVDEPPSTAGQPLTDDVAAAVAGGGIVLALGRISWEKGLDRLLAALPFAPSARAVIAGADADGEAARLTDRARELGVADRVTILARFVEGADKEALFAAARVFAMTSLSENFGLSAFEAMRRGVPVLATPNVGMSEIVREAGAGAVVEADPAAISAGLNALLGNAAASEAMGRAGQARVIADYSWQAVTRRMEDLYRSLLPVKA